MGIQEHGSLGRALVPGLGQESGQEGRLDARGGLRSQDQHLAVRVPDGQDASGAPDHPAVEPDLPAGRSALLPEA